MFKKETHKNTDAILKQYILGENKEQSRTSDVTLNKVKNISISATKKCLGTLATACCSKNEFQNRHLYCFFIVI